MEAFSDLKTPAFVLDLEDIEGRLHHLAKQGGAQTEADRQTAKYYLSDDSHLAWVSRQGVTRQADTLLTWLHGVGEEGLSENAFSVEAIERDLKRMRDLDFDESANTINAVASRLEYQLTKACMRYTMGERYGFINPQKVFNSLDAESQDTLGNVLKYKGLFDVDMDHPSSDEVAAVMRRVGCDSLSAYLKAIQPKGKYFHQLKTMLSKATSTEERRRILVNMERSRWRRHQPIAEKGKRIVVNIPAYHLYAYSDDDMLDMRVVCGNVRTKTPQLSSHIEYMEVNPQWVIPMSIIRGEVAHRAGDSAYFARNRYNIYDRSTNQQIDVRHVSRQQMLSGNYRVAQAGGAGNSLGRIVFRFKNNFSVFLHDTSNPAAFNRDSRAISHGCVRVSKPFDLAKFVLDSPDEWLLDRIRISMGLGAETERGQQYLETHEGDSHKLISYVPVKPRVPLYILYNTLWPDADGVMRTWPDVYGYDEVLWKNLQPYL